MSDIDHTTVFGIFHKMALPEGATPVENFDIEKFLGRWYEIVRMDYFWEKKHLSNVYAEYRTNDEGTIDVHNSGYNEKKGEWQSYDGEARPRSENTVAALEVSFFGPTWSGYNVVAIDEDYKYALVFGRNTNYIWLLSRERTMPEEIIAKYKTMATDCGYDPTDLVYTDQSRQVPEYQD